MTELFEVQAPAASGEFVVFGDSPFQLFQPFAPAGDQPAAIDQLVAGLDDGLSFQTLLGVTGSGKTFTMANVIARMGRPAIVFAPNKTLAAQLYSEFRDYFPKNAVEYFVSYYDYFQPEAYVPQLVDLVVDVRVLRDVGVAARDVRLGLVVVVVRDEILDGVLGKELAHLRVELRGQRLVGRDHERRPAGACNHVCDRVGLARAGHAKERLVREPVAQPLYQGIYGGRLVASGLEGAMKPEGAVRKRDDVGHRANASGQSAILFNKWVRTPI
jgi:hypothetical protein